MLAVVIEAMTVTSLKEFNSINNSFKSLSSKNKTFNKDISLAEIAYTQRVSKELMKLIIDEESNTFKKISHKKFFFICKLSP